MIKILRDVFEAGELKFEAGKAYEDCDATRIQLAVGNGVLVSPEVADEPQAVEPVVEVAPVAEAVVEPETPDAPEERRRGRPRKHGA